MVAQLYLSRRNLLVLLSKLDRKKAGEVTACTIIKLDDKNPTYKQSPTRISVTAVEDDDYYVNRPPGEMHPSDEPELQPLCRPSDNLEQVIEMVIEANTTTCVLVREGSDKALSALVGQVMKLTKGRDNPALVIELLRKKFG